MVILSEFVVAPAPPRPGSPSELPLGRRWSPSWTPAAPPEAEPLPPELEEGPSLLETESALQPESASTDALAEEDATTPGAEAQARRVAAQQEKASREAEGQMMAVCIPRNVVPGQPLLAKVAGGQMVPFRAPADARPGMLVTITVERNAAAPPHAAPPVPTPEQRTTHAAPPAAAPAPPAAATSGGGGKRRKRKAGRSRGAGILAGKWEARLAELKAYREENGDCRVPGTQGNPHQVLGKWASVQRTAYRKKELSAARIARAHGLTLNWC